MGDGDKIFQGGRNAVKIFQGGDGDKIFQGEMELKYFMGGGEWS